MIGTIWNTIFYYPVLNLLIVFYNVLFDNLGLAIIVMAILFRLLLLPLMKRQTEMTKKMSSIKPEMDKLQKKITFIPQLLILSVLIQVIRNVTGGELEGIYPFISDWLNNGTSLAINTRFLVWDLTKSYNDLSGEFGRFSVTALPYLGLSVLVGFSQYLTSKFTQVIQGTAPKKEKGKKKKGEVSPEDMQKKMSQSFMFILPFTTIFIAISAPAALSLYWAIQSLMLVIQYMLLDWDKTQKGIQNLFTKLKARGKGSNKVSK